MTHISKTTLFKSFSIYTIGRGLEVVSSLLLLPLFTKTLSQVEFGIISIFWLLKPVTYRILNIGVDVALSIRIYKESPDEFSNSFFNGVSIVTTLFLLISAIFFVFDSAIPVVLHESVSFEIFLLFIMSQYFAFFINVIQNVLQYERKHKQNVILSVSPPILTALTSFILISFFLESYASYIIGMFVSQFIFGLISFYLLRRRYKLLTYRFQFSVIKKLLKVGLPVVPGTLGGIILAMGDRYIIKYMMGLQEVAIYTYGYRYSEFILLSFFQPFQKAFKPEIYRSAAESIVSAAKTSIKIQNNILVFLTLLLFIVIIPMKDVLILLSSENYDGSYIIFLLSLFGILIFHISQVNAVLVHFKERTDIDMVVTFSGAVLNVIGNFWAINKYGIAGAAIVTILSYAFMMILREILMHKLLGVRREKIPRELLSILLFVFYLFLTYTIDTMSYPILKTYSLKIILFITAGGLYYFMFPEIKSRLISLHKKVKTNA